MRLSGLHLLIGIVGTCGVAHAAEAVRGATVPWITYEAEAAQTSGTVLGPTYIGNIATREASGRSCVQLNATGQYIDFTAANDAQGLVVRYSLPDTADGVGQDATLALYINGQFVQKLSMSSKLAYLYGNYPFTNTPSSGTPRHFWDELHIMPGEIHAGDVVRLQKDSDDTAAQYLIDFIDLEVVPAPLDQPANSLSVTDYGATPNDTADDRTAFLNAIAAAKSQNKSVWIPPGNFVIKGVINVNNVTIHGAGIWYSNLVNVNDYVSANRVSIQGNGSNVVLSDFAILGHLNYRNDSEANDGLGGSFGSGSSISNIWVEHTKTGAWMINSDGLTVDSCRFRDTIADGINLCVGMRNTTVNNCTARGGGDDCFAMWPATYTNATYPAGGNRFTSCTAQLPFLAQGFSVYGGDSNVVYACVAVDIPYGAGLFASTTFPTVSGFSGTTRYSQITLNRVGDDNGAIGIVANLVDLTGLSFSEIDLNNVATDGIKFISLTKHAINTTALDQIRIVNSGLSGSGYGIVEAAGAVGSATISNYTDVNAKSGDRLDNAPNFTLTVQTDVSAGAGNSPAASPPTRSPRKPRLRGR